MIKTVNFILLIATLLLCSSCRKDGHIISLRIVNDTSSQISRVLLEDIEMSLSYGVISQKKFKERSDMSMTLPRNFHLTWLDSESVLHESDLTLKLENDEERFDGIFVIKITEGNNVDVNLFSRKEFYRETNALIEHHFGGLKESK